MEMSLSHGSFSVKYTNAVLPWLLLLLCPRCGGLGAPPDYLSICVNQSVKVCVSLPTCRLPPVIYNLPYLWAGPFPSPSFSPMQCYDCRIALVEFDFFTGLLVS